jgi:GTP diphosphokinase / guanosine-3',5'-bis(diphosphate) 3'-diphosphatase
MSDTLTTLRELIQDRKEDRPAFFRRVLELYPTRSWQNEMITLAYDHPKDGFRGMKRKDDETRSFEHSRGVALILMDHLGIYEPWMIAAALLHDCIEDLDHYTLGRFEGIFLRFGDAGKRLIELLERMTKLSTKEGFSKGDAERIYHQWFESADIWFFYLKLADRLYNLLTIESLSKEKQLAMIVETETYYLPYARKFHVLYPELRMAITEAQERLVA